MRSKSIRFFTVFGSGTRRKPILGPLAASADSTRVLSRSPSAPSPTDRLTAAAQKLGATLASAAL
jgi:hypothetical protein